MSRLQVRLSIQRRAFPIVRTLSFSLLVWRRWRWLQRPFRVLPFGSDESEKSGLNHFAIGYFLPSGLGPSASQCSESPGPFEFSGQLPTAQTFSCQQRQQWCRNLRSGCSLCCCRHRYVIGFAPSLGSGAAFEARVFPSLDGLPSLSPDLV